MPLTGKQKRHLRALGHHLDPVVQVGSAGLTEGVERKVAVELERHELIKVKVGQDCAVAASEAAPHLAAYTGAEVVGVLGRTALLYLAHPKEPTIRLPGVPRKRAASAS